LSQADDFLAAVGFSWYKAGRIIKIRRLIVSRFVDVNFFLTVEIVMIDIISDYLSGRITDAVAEHALKRPDNIALTDEFQALTYGELNRRSNRLAHYLRSLGVGKDALVGLCLPRSLDMVVGALGILKSGAAYVPMDPAFPADRLAFILDDAQAHVLITGSSVAQRLPTTRREVVNVNAPQIAAEPDHLPYLEKAPRNLAYVAYTSGSTGKPKGVEITHGSLTNLISWHQEAFSVSPADRASHLAGVSFDASVWEVWPYLSAGASIHVVDEITRASAEHLRDWLVAKRITISFVPTPLAERLLVLEWPRPSALRILLTGGDTLGRYPPANLPFKLVNNYGPTECAVVATSGPVEPDNRTGMLPAIGRAIANTEIYILDEKLNRAAAGTPGEIYIGGAGLARGYRNLPDLTAATFIANPFSAEPDDKLFKSGDFGRFLPDGQIVFLGRADEQIKIRGHRIEPNEIVCALNRHPKIRESLVVVGGQTADERRLIAYLEMDDEEAGVNEAGLRDFLREHLPDDMVPTVFVRVDAFPLTANGKIDRAALPLPNSANRLPNDVRAVPRTPTEQRVATIVASALDLEAIDRNDNFFMLGGHSMLGAQLIARLRQAFEVEIDLRTLFDEPTVAALAAEIDRLAGNKNLSVEPHPAPMHDNKIEQKPFATAPFLEELKTSVVRNYAAQMGRRLTALLK
jgi:amino acid adenylation domain-containing protein